MADILPIDFGTLERYCPVSRSVSALAAHPALVRMASCIVVLAAACAGVLWLRSAAKAALPVLDGDVHLAGLSAPVTVRRDAHGVPHIEAATQDDLFVAQGYVTAQDRLWQMDAYRRNAEGELAEIMGPRSWSTTRRSACCNSGTTARTHLRPTCPQPTAPGSTITRAA